MGRKLLNNVEVDFLRVLWPRYARAKTLEVFNEYCNRSLTLGQLKAAAGRLKLGTSAHDGRFKQGHAPANKGRLGYAPPGCEKGWFKKGHKGIPSRTHPLYAEVTRRHKRGHLEVLIKLPGPSPFAAHEKLGWHRESHWLRKAVWVWQEAKGPVPKGSVVVQLDGDPENCELSNLDCVPRAVLARLNHHTAPRYAGKDLNPARVRLAQVKMALSKRQKG